MLPRPVLRFREGTALTPYEGFKLGLKPYYGPSRIVPVVITHRDYLRDVEELFENLKAGLRGYGGAGEWFDLELEDPEVVAVGSVREYLDAVARMPLGDIVVAVIPDEMAVDYEDDPYMPLKREIAITGIPSQMVEFSTVRNLKDSPFVLFNLMLNIYAKVGGIPWVLDDALPSDVVFGIDILRRRKGEEVALGLTCLTGKGAFRFEWEGSMSSPVEWMDVLSERIVGLSEDMGFRDLRRVCFHIEEPTGFASVEVVRRLIPEMRERGILVEDGMYMVVAVRKSGVPRPFKGVGARYGVPDKGLAFVLDYYRGVVLTSGYPEFAAFSPLGLVKPLAVEILDSNFEHNVKSALKEVYWLSEMHWASGFRSSKHPISTLYAHRVSSFLSAGVEPAREYKGKAWFL
ncbi:MAG: Piwi domain-containing protein [Candidatus Baldrarchaeia archaeon]